MDTDTQAVMHEQDTRWALEDSLHVLTLLMEGSDLPPVHTLTRIHDRIVKVLEEKEGNS